MKILWLAAVLPVCMGLFEDQVGKFDWRNQYIGCPSQVLFDRPSSKGHNLLISTYENVFASISLGSGSINWRRIQEDNGHNNLPIASDKSALYSVSDGGRVLRTWSKASGALKWQSVLSETVSQTEPSLLLTKKSVIVSSSDSVSSFDLSGTQEWTRKVEAGAWNTVATDGDNIAYISFETGVLTVQNIVEGKLSDKRSVAVQGDKFVRNGRYVAGWDRNSVNIIDVFASTLTISSVNSNSIRKVEALSNDYIAIISDASTKVYSMEKKSEVLNISERVDAIAADDKFFVVVAKSRINGFEKSTGKQKFSLDIPNINSSIKELYASSVKKEIEILAVFEDCRVEFFVITPETSQIQSEWIREEGLARVTSVEMVDLPLSESQQMIEDEFAAEEANIISSFVRRVISQGIQIQKWFFRTIHQIMSLSKISSKVGSFSQLIDTVRSTSKSGSSEDSVLERDFFNLRKMIIVATLDGSVFGLDSEGGRIVWKLWLGERFSALQSELGEHKVPLYIQRSTAFYQLNGQAVVVFQDSKTRTGSLVFFDPITGVVIERKQLQSQIKTVNLLPVLSKEHLHTLLIVEQGNKVSAYPTLSEDSLSTINEIYWASLSAKGLEGFVLNLRNLKISPTWTADLNLGSSEKIIAVKSKPLNEKVHSQGRVLIDRNVQYKYVNPNLVVVATLDEASQNLALYMMDSVTGQIVHTAKTAKVALPVHIVHCENWVVFSYWSEKSRRTEIGIVELYEGEELTNQDQFDSQVPTKKAPEVNSQSYVYAHGIDAMGVTETEQGLTTRSILLALPFGGIHEVSRKLIDANRPLELTQEMREEMMIPYMPEIFIATEDMVNYNQTVHRVRGIKTAPSGLESTSLMLAYGVDLFFTRLNPSGTFDILKDDFDHLLISLVLIGLIVGSIVSKRLARNNALKAAWM